MSTLNPGIPLAEAGSFSGLSGRVFIGRRIAEALPVFAGRQPGMAFEKLPEERRVLVADGVRHGRQGTKKSVVGQFDEHPLYPKEQTNFRTGDKVCF